MKKLSCLGILCLFCLLNLNGQEEIRDTKIILGGALSYVYQTNTNYIPFNSVPGTIYAINAIDTKNSSFSISPYAAKEINQHWAIGISLLFQTSKYTGINDNFMSPIPFKVTRQSFGGGIFGRYYFNPQNKLIPFLQPYFNYNMSNGELEQSSNVVSEDKSSSFNLGITAGLLYKITPRLNATLRFGSISYMGGTRELTQGDFTDKTDFSTFGTNFNLASLFIGVELRL